MALVSEVEYWCVSVGDFVPPMFSISADLSRYTYTKLLPGLHALEHIIADRIASLVEPYNFFVNATLDQELMSFQISGPPDCQDNLVGLHQMIPIDTPVSSTEVRYALSCLRTEKEMLGLSQLNDKKTLDFFPSAALLKTPFLEAVEDARAILMLAKWRIVRIESGEITVESYPEVFGASLENSTSLLTASIIQMLAPNASGFLSIETIGRSDRAIIKYRLGKKTLYGSEAYKKLKGENSFLAALHGLLDSWDPQPEVRACHIAQLAPYFSTELEMCTTIKAFLEPDVLRKIIARETGLYGVPLAKKLSPEISNKSSAPLARIDAVSIIRRPRQTFIQVDVYNSSEARSAISVLGHRTGLLSRFARQFDFIDEGLVPFVDFKQNELSFGYRHGIHLTDAKRNFICKRLLSLARANPWIKATG